MTAVAIARTPCPCGKPHKARGLCASHYRTAVRSKNSPWTKRLLPVQRGTQYMYVCDTCGLVGTSRQVSAVGIGTHYCRDHLDLARCLVCGRAMRRGDATLRYWPNTVRTGTSGRCRPCTDLLLEKPVDLTPLPDYAVTKMKALVAWRVPDPIDQAIVLAALIGEHTL